MLQKRIWVCTIGPFCSHLFEITNVMPLFSTDITTIYRFTPFLKHPPSKLLPNSGSCCTAAKRFIMR